MTNSLSVKTLADKVAERQTQTEHSAMSLRLRKAMFEQLRGLAYGTLKVREDLHLETFTGSAMPELEAEIEILNPAFYAFVAFGGSVGAGEAYMNGYWTSPNLTKVIRVFALNQTMMDGMEGGLARLTAPLKKGFHWLNKNTQSGSRKNIVAHYDLGNDFFKLFLDPTMMYSAGIFLDKNDSMEQASRNKLHRICQRLRLKPTDHLVEIGTGWGSFAIYAAQNFGCKVTTTTISDEQYDYALERIQKLGLESQITLLKQDYRKLEGQFDKLVSIEMIEAVGHQYFDTFFEKCSQLLKPEGEMLLQSITIADQRFDSAKKDVDFIKRYIFPGSCIPSVDAISRSLQKATDFRVQNLEDIGVHYARTLKLWREAFFEKVDLVKQQGFSEAFIRMWDFYLSYCEGGFEERVISNVQLHLVKPVARVPMDLPQLSGQPVEQ